MARVQVRDLPSAQRLQATVQSGGDFGVAVQQAGSNKMLELADTLSSFNTALKEYGAIAAVDAEMYEQELKRLKPEELSERLSKTEKELDSLTRKGVIPWLASPLNQKRKRRAEGKAAHDLFLQRLVDAEGRLNNPQEGDDGKTTAQIIEEERQAFVAENPALQEGTYGGEGFQEALNPTILNLTRQYDGEKARVARAETLLQNTSAIYRLAKDAPLDSAEYDLVMEQSLGSWAELNSFNAAQQIKVIENVAEQLANLPGGEQRAYEFLQYAEQNFYVGNQLFYKNEDQVDRIMNLIEREVEAGQRIREGNRNERLEEEKGEFVIALSALENTGKTTYKGAEYTDRFELLKAAEEFARNDPDTRFGGAVIPQFEQVIKGDLDAEQIQRGFILRESPIAQRAETRLNEKIKNIIKMADLSDEVKLSPKLEEIYRDAVLEFNKIREDKLRDMVRSGKASDPVLAGSELDQFVLDEIQKMTPVLQDRIERLGESVDKEVQRMDAAKKEQQFTETEAITGTNQFLQDALLWSGPAGALITSEFLTDTEKEITQNILKNINAAANPNTSEVQREAALTYISEHKEEALESLAKIGASNDLLPGMMGKRPPLDFFDSDNAPREFVSSLLKAAFTGEQSFKELITKGRELKKQAVTQYFQMARYSGVFQDVEVLENKVTPHYGLKFEYGDDVNSNNTVFLTKEQVERVRDIPSDPDAVPSDIVQKARLVGESEDILQFVRNQVRIVTAFSSLLDK